MSKVAILGSGNAACAYAAYLGKRGHDVRLYDSKRFEANLTEIKKRGGMDITGIEQNFGPIGTVTTDLKEAVDGVKVIMIVVPGFGHKPLAEQLAPVLQDGQVVTLNPGAVFGALEFLETIRRCGCDKDVIVGEIASNIFACRRTGPTSVNISGKKEVIETAAIPASRVQEMISVLDEFFPHTYVPVPNVIYTSLGYNNLIIHPAGAILNMGRVEYQKGQFDFYWEGLTPGVCRNIEAVDAERIAVGEALHCHLETFMEITHHYYGHEERETVYDFFSQSEVHGGSGPSAPNNLKHRYITEDIPYALVPLSAVGKVLGVETPVIDSLITLASVANHENYRETGRSLKALGLEGLNAEELIHRFETGK